LSNSTEALLAVEVIETDAYNEAKNTLELKVL
ncbi:MAG: endonuclease G, partial [Cognaticolwellia sp.]